MLWFGYLRWRPAALCRPYTKWLHAEIPDGPVCTRPNAGGGINRGCLAFPGINRAQIPTQKPIGLLNAFMSDFTLTILDPFMGSATTGKAALKAGCSFVGIENDDEHFDIAVQRMITLHAQVDIFTQTPAPMVQESLL